MIKTPIGQALDLIWSPHPLNPILDRAARQFLLGPGMTLREILVASGIDHLAEIIVSLNGAPVRVAEWDTLIPDAGDVLQIQAVVAGGDGSNVLQLVALVVLTYFTMGAGAAAWMPAGMSGTLGGAMLGAAAFMAGSMVIGAIFKPSGLATDQSSSTTSPTYSLSGGQNRLRPYEALPVLFGRHVIFPDLNSKPYTEYLDGEQYLYQTFNFGLMPNMELSDFKIGDTLLSDYSEAELVYLDANNQWPAESGFYGNVDSTAAGVISSATGPVIRSTGLETVRIGLDIETVLFKANDSGGFSAREATVKIEYRAVGGTDWLGFVPDNVGPLTHYWAKMGQIETTTQEGYWDAAGVWVPPVTVVGKWKQFGFDTNTSPTAHVEGDSAGTYTVFSGGVAAVPLTWKWVEVGTDKKPKPALSIGNNDTLVLRGAAAEQKRYSVYRVVTSGQYEVRVTRVTADETSTKVRADINWSALKSYQLDGGSYPDQTVVGLKIKATGQLNGVVQQLSAVGQALTPVWSGAAWVAKGTTNPAWWYLNFARGLRDGSGRLLYGAGLLDSQIDLDAITAWAAFCEAQGLNFSAVLDTNQSCMETLEGIARCGFGSVTWAPGKLSVVWDKVNSPAAGAFGMANILSGTFSVQYVTEDLAEEVVVSYMDQESWTSASVRETMPGLSGAPARSSQLTLWGCTNNGQAVKYARSIMAGHVYRTRRMSWETDTQGFVNTRGDVVRLSHDLTQWGYSGRVVAVNGAMVTLDKAVPRSGAAEYLMIARPDGTLVDYTLLAGSVGDSDTLTASAGVDLQAGLPPIDHVWFFSPLVTPGKKVKILSVVPLSEHRLRIVATDEVPEYYAAIGGSWTPPPVQTLLAGPVSISGLVVTSQQRVIDGSLTNEVSAAWVPGGGVTHCGVEFYVDGGLLSTFAEVRGSGKSVAVSSGLVRVSVTPFGANGAGPTQTASLNLSGIPAPAFPNVTLLPGMFSIRVQWAFGDSRTDIAYTEIYASKTASTVAAAALLGQVAYPTQQFEHLGLTPGETWRYWVRAVDTLLQPSDWHDIAGTAASPSTDQASLLLQLQNALGMDQLAAELAAPISQIPGMAEDILQRAIDIDILTDRVLFERAVTDATIEVDPVTGQIQLLATANVTTEVEARLTAVETDLNAAEGTLTSTVATVGTLGSDLSSAQTQITQLADQVALTASQVYVDDAVETAAGALTVESANAAQALAEAALRQALGLDTATDKELAARSRIAAAEFDLTAQADELDAEASARLALAAVVDTQAAALTSEQSARANADAAEASARVALAARVTTAEGGVSANAAAITVEQSARATADAALASQITTVQAGLDADIAAVEQTASATASALDGVEARWGVKVQTMVDGKRALAGIELLAGTDGETVFAVLADKLLIYRPDGSGAPKQIVTLGQVNGVTALGLDGNLIVDDSIVARHLAVASLSAISADIGEVTAGLLRNTADTSRLDLDATGTEIALKIGAALTVLANGAATFGGTLTAAAVNAVDTVNIAGNAVTVPLSGQGTSGAVTSAYVFDGATPVVIIANGMGENDGASFSLSLSRNGVVFHTTIQSHIPNGGIGSMAITVIDTPPAGSAYYTVTVVGAAANKSCGLVVLGTKR